MNGVGAVDISGPVENWQVEEELERVFLSHEMVSGARRVVGRVAAVLAAVLGVGTTVWVFLNVGVAAGLLAAYVLPLFVLLVMVGLERVVPMRPSRG